MNKDNTKTSKNRQKKEGIVGELAQKVEKATAFVFTNYQGLTHLQLEALKKAVKKVDSEFVATKNTLLLRTLEKYNLSDEERKQFEKPTATLFIYNDFVEPLKALSKTIKEFTLPAIKFGLFDGKVITAENVVKIAALPPLPVLRAQALGTMKSPIQNLHRALTWNMQTLVLTLNAIKEKKA